MQGDPHPALSIGLQFWGCIGPLVGLLVGHVMTRSWQREQWLRDSKKQEYKELLTSLTIASVDLIEFLASQGTPLQVDGSGWRSSLKISMVKLSDCIFIAHDLDSSKIPKRYMELIDQIREGGEPVGDFIDKMGMLIEEVRQLALKTK